MDTHWASVVQLVGQAWCVPSHRYGLHAGAPTVPAGSVVQVPTEPLSVHDPQAAPHAELQQTPLTQSPDAHCRVSAQAAPFACAVSQLPLALQK